MLKITIKELHRTTGKYVRQAGASRSPVMVTDHGKPVAVLTRPSQLKPRQRRRTLLPAYKTLMAKVSSHDLIDDLAAVRGDR
jgi:prevent-host-death family protein